MDPHARAVPERYFFMHMPKTAGMSLFQRLIHHHGERSVYPLPADRGRPGSYMSIEYLQDRFATHRENLRVIAGHFPLCLDEVLGVTLTTFTILRDPVERTLSLLRQHKQHDQEFRDASLEDVYADPALLHGLIHNFMVKCLTVTVDEIERGVMTMVPYDQARLERAKDNLENRVELFGVQEDFDEFCRQLGQRFGWDLGVEPAYPNSTAAMDVSDEFRERIAYDNALDVELYRFAKELEARRTAEVAN
jgi:Galactose-3-O-sulfotransferase